MRRGKCSGRGSRGDKDIGNRIFFFCSYYGRNYQKKEVRPTPFLFNLPPESGHVVW